MMIYNPPSHFLGDLAGHEDNLCLRIYEEGEYDDENGDDDDDGDEALSGWGGELADKSLDGSTPTCRKDTGCITISILFIIFYPHDYHQDHNQDQD